MSEKQVVIMGDDYGRGFTHGLDFMRHVIEQYTEAAPEHEAQALIKLLGYLSPPMAAEKQH